MVELNPRTPNDSVLTMSRGRGRQTSFEEISQSLVYSRNSLFGTISCNIENCSAAPMTFSGSEVIYNSPLTPETWKHEVQLGDTQGRKPDANCEVNQ